ncbi:MAG: KilA-N domain-containing protein [Paludibacteraceae bacterium]|jgi:hypothetical protein|nr:KilA-N domain-containing protein [Paludibacteraceae bacterium]
MAKTNKINAEGTEITILKIAESEFISITDIARHKDAEHTDSIIQNWMRNRNTIELLGFWEMIYNPGFKPLEFEGFRKQAGLNNGLFSAISKASTRYSYIRDCHNRKDCFN